MFRDPVVDIGFGIAGGVVILPVAIDALEGVLVLLLQLVDFLAIPIAIVELELEALPLVQRVHPFLIADAIDALELGAQIGDIDSHYFCHSRGARRSTKGAGVYQLAPDALTRNHKFGLGTQRRLVGRPTNYCSTGGAVARRASFG